MSEDTECLHCGEPLGGGAVVRMPVLGDRGLIVRRVHNECALRMVLGGLNHLKGRCSCCGGTDPPDPEGMTRREAAVAAVVFWKESDKFGGNL